jgi:hypothetical protein
MAYQIVPRSNPHIALGVYMPTDQPSDRPGWGVRMLPQGSGDIVDTLWDMRVLFYSSGPGALLSVIGTSLISRRCGLRLLWMRQGKDGYITLGPASEVDPYSAWIFSGDTGDAFVYIYPAAPDIRQYTLGLNDGKTRAVLSPDPKENWWFVPQAAYGDGNASEPIQFASASGLGYLAGNQNGAVFLFDIKAAGDPGQSANNPGNQWRLITPLVNRVPLNTQLIRNEANSSYLHCAGIGQGLNLLKTIPGDHESYGPCLWSPGVTPVAQGFDIPNPSMGGAMATVAPWKPGTYGIYLQDWQAENGVNQLWTFQR